MNDNWVWQERRDRRPSSRRRVPPTMPSPEIRILMDSFDRISDQALRRELIAMAECLATMTKQRRTTAR